MPTGLPGQAQSGAHNDIEHLCPPGTADMGPNLCVICYAGNLWRGSEGG